ncbi:DUF6282 family protein [Halomarina ordinaria]|uniref:DUF6282 family protein n=1 Tax=Halomarina ordinaria TaxID=3033939 RepID=A0ABD5UBV0_9EURY|nr:DUF6282 family protein [Halomarina sp. PSRA2]
MSVSLEGAVDVHVHTAPDLVERYAFDLDLAREARDAGMRGLVVKSHVVPTVGRVDQVNRALGEDLLYGGVALNAGTGGLNPEAVRIALELGGRIVWLPTAWSANHARQERRAGADSFVGQRLPGPDEELVVARDGSLLEETSEIVDLVAEYGAVLGTGHVGAEEVEAVVAACADRGADVLVNHPFFRATELSIATQESLAEQGATMEYCAYAVDSTEGHSVERVAEAVARVGPERCLLATDYGQVGNSPVDGLAAFARRVVDAGVPASTVRELVRDRPVELFGL